MKVTKFCLVFICLLLTGCAAQQQKMRLDTEAQQTAEKKLIIQQKIAELEQQFNQSPDNIDLIHQMAKMALQINDADKCLSVLEKIKNPNSQTAETFHYRATASKFKGDNKEAVRNWEESLKRDSKYSKASYNLGNLHYEENNLKKAQTYWEQTLEIEPSYHKAAYNLGVLHHSQGNLKKAMEHYQNTLEQNPEHANAHLNLGLVFCRMDKLDEGIPYFEKATVKNPTNYFAHLNLGLGKAKQGKLEEAIQSLEQAKEIQDKDPWIYYNLAIAYDSVGNTKKAVSLLEKALELNPDFSEARTEYRSLFRSLKGS